MKRIKNVRKNLILYLLAAITFLTTLVGILSFSFQKKVYAEENSNLTDFTTNPGKDDKNFRFVKDENDLFPNDVAGKTMTIAVKVADNDELINPQNYVKKDSYKNCNWWLCNGATEKEVWFNSAALKFHLYKYNGTGLSDKILTYELSCDSEGNWTDSVISVSNESKSFNLRCKGLLKSSNIFTEKNFSKYVEILLTAEDYDSNYCLKFDYDYLWYRRNYKSSHHWHEYSVHIDNKGSQLSEETNTPYGIFYNKVYNNEAVVDKSLSLEQQKEAIINYYQSDYSKYFDIKYASSTVHTLKNFVDNVFNAGEKFTVETIKVSFLRPLITEKEVFDENNETKIEKVTLPFAYMYTTKVTVSLFRGRIKTRDVIDALEEKDVLEKNELENFLRIFGSNTAVGNFLDETLKSSTDGVSVDNEYTFAYYPTYVVKLRSSSGNEMNVSLKLTSMSSYYSDFCIGANKDYSVMDADFYWSVYNAILNRYNLRNVTVPDGINGGTRDLSGPSDLYGYWGFALVPAGGGFDGVLSKFIDGNVVSNGIYQWLTMKVSLSGKALASLQDDFGYSYFSRIFGKIFNSLGSVADATFYMFFISETEVTDNFIYVLAENGSVEVDDTSGISDKAAKKVTTTLVNGVKTVFRKAGNVLKSPKKVLILVGIVFLVVILLWVCIKLFKRL